MPASESRRPSDEKVREHHIRNGARDGFGRIDHAVDGHDAQRAVGQERCGGQGETLFTIERVAEFQPALPIQKLDGWGRTFHSGCRRRDP